MVRIKIEMTDFKTGAFCTKGVEDSELASDLNADDLRLLLKGLITTLGFEPASILSEDE